jgi:hypothetical protein
LTIGETGPVLFRTIANRGVIANLSAQPNTAVVIVAVFFYRSFYRVPNVGAWKEKQS